MKALTLRDVSTTAMVAGNEKRFHTIIHDGMVKEWVGFGWITERTATADDLRSLPSVMRQLLWRETFPYSASIDASLALVGRCGFPLGQGKWNYTMAAAYGSFSIIPNDPNSTGIHDKRCGHAHGAPTIPLAILIALLSALEASNAQ
jgi:hypothetical protein